MNDNYAPTETTAKRAAELWRRMLRSPQYDNGDKSEVGFVAQAMAMMLPNNVDEERLSAFCQALENLILTPSKHGYPRTSLDVDYGPCETLREAAEVAGLKCEFPWKTNMRIHGSYVWLSAGYGGKGEYHYQLSDGRWLVTTLSGDDVEKIKRYVVDGTLPEFCVEA